MKNLKARNLLLVGLISTGLFGFESTSFAFGKKDKEPISIDGNRLENRKEYKDMKHTLSHIENDKIRIDFYKAELKANRKADLVIPTHMSKKELRKAKADLRHDKKYLRIDKRDLKSDQNVAICDAKQDERAAKKDLRQAKRELRSDLFFGRTDELTADAELVQALEAKVLKQENETALIKEDADEFFAYLENEIDTVA